MRNLITLLLITLLFLVSCQKTEQQCSNISLASTNISNQEEYIIIETIVDEYFSSSDLIHLSQESHSVSDSSRFAMYFDSDEVDFESETIEEYILLNDSPFIWGELFEKERDLISKEELDCLFDNNSDGWAAYYSKYENSEAYLKFGRPIQEGNRAIVTYEHACNWLCAYGYTVTLQKVNGQWIVENHILIWIS